MSRMFRLQIILNIGVSCTKYNKISPFATHTSLLSASNTYEEGLCGSSSEISEILQNVMCNCLKKGEIAWEKISPKNMKVYYIS